jgi:ssDNA-binding Zn-finger/Zn-ribbon topoisomerase 1
MKENARQGYFNGSVAPFGYKTMDAGQTGLRGRFKKKLAVLEPEAEIVREIFSLYVNGKDNCPRIGMKEIAKSLNERGIRLRGRLWRVQTIHQILSSTTYVGWHVFNKLDSRSRKIKDEAEWVKTTVPAIIEQNLFDKATKLRSAYTPLRCAPRRETSPNLLTGLLKCDCCGATMVAMTAKHGRYHYYKCSNRISKGNTACRSKNYPMEKLDNLVLEAFRDTIYTPDYIRNVIDELRKGASKHGGEEKMHLKRLESELAEIDEAENKLYEAIEKGVLELDDRLKTRMQQHKTRRETLTAELAAIQQKHQTPLQHLTPQKIEAVSRVLKKRFAESTPFSRAYLKATVNEIRISDDLLKLKGAHTAMADLIAADGKLTPDGMVHRFIPDWRLLWDLNPCYRRERDVNYPLLDIYGFSNSLK